MGVSDRGVGGPFLISLLRGLASDFHEVSRSFFVVKTATESVIVRRVRGASSHEGAESLSLTVTIPG